MITSLPRQYSFSPTPKVIRQSARLAKPTGWVNGEGRMLPQPAQTTGRDIMLIEDLPAKKRINYDVVMFYGPRGDGKSLSATATCWAFRQKWAQIGCNNKIFTNIHCTFADMSHPRLVDELVTFPDWAHDCVVLIDELASYFPPNRAMSREYLWWTTFLQQIRKLRMTVIFTTQYPTYVGAGSNIQINWYIKPHLFNRVYSKRARAWVADSVRLEFYDWWGSQTGMPIQHRWPPYPNEACHSITMHGISPVASMYDSDEPVAPFYSPNRDRIIGRTWAKEIAEEREKDIEQAKATAEARREQVLAAPDSIPAILEAHGEEFQVMDVIGLVQQVDKSMTVSKLIHELSRLGYNVNGRGAKALVTRRPKAV